MKKKWEKDSFEGLVNFVKLLNLTMFPVSGYPVCIGCTSKANEASLQKNIGLELTCLKSKKVLNMLWL